MKKILSLAVFFLLLSTGIKAQDSEYRDITKQFVEMGATGINADQMKTTFKSGIQMIVQKLKGIPGLEEAMGEKIDSLMTGLDDMMNSSLGDYFRSEEFINDVTDVTEQLYQQNFTLDELKEMLSLYKGEEGQAFLKRNSKLANNSTIIAQEMMDAALALATGDSLPSIKKVDCPKEYRETFDKLTSKTLTPLLEKIKNGGLGDGSTDANAKKMQDYLTKALPESLLRINYENLSLEDLKANLKFSENPLLQRVTAISLNIDPKMMEPIQKKIQEKVQQKVGSLFGN